MSRKLFLIQAPTFSACHQALFVGVFSSEAAHRARTELFSRRGCRRSARSHSRQSEGSRMSNTPSVRSEA